MPLLLGQPQLFFEALQLHKAIVITKVNKKPIFKKRCINIGL